MLYSCDLQRPWRRFGSTFQASETGDDIQNNKIWTFLGNCSHLIEVNASLKSFPTEMNRIIDI